jgi:mRNA interferase HigB
MADKPQGCVSMHIISKKRLRNFWEKHPRAKAPLEEWHQVVRKVKWGKFADVRATYRSADSVNQFVVFDIGGNKFRLIAFIDYEYGKVFVRSVLTHKDYEKGNWKKDEFGKDFQLRRKKRWQSNEKNT